MNRSFKGIVEETIYPLMSELCHKAVDQKDDLIIEGQKAFGDHVPFATGTLFKSYTTLFFQKENIGFGEDEITEIRDIISFSLKYKVNTFGIMNLLISLYEYEKRGMLSQILNEQDYSELNERLNWRIFVHEESLDLKNGLPFNYYSVAFRVAKLREALGFESETYSEVFLDIYLYHAKKYSLNGWYMDETIGGGRFDRYTTIVPAELADLYHFVGEKPPEAISIMLRRSCDIYLQIANEHGYGYAYGRSLGAHGDTGALEVLPIAAKLGILDEDEKSLAYSYSVKCAERILDFWIDTDTGLINMWDKGRKIDDYRNKKRIFEVNLDICMKIVDALTLWDSVDLTEIQTSAAYAENLKKITQNEFFFYDHSEYERGLAIIRDREHVFQLPLISGAHKCFEQTPYLPLPFEPFFIEGSPDVKIPYLIPQIKLNDGRKLMPLCYMKDIVTTRSEGRFAITYKTDALVFCGRYEPETFSDITSETKYTFERGQILREDTFYIHKDSEINSIIMEFCTFSEDFISKKNIIEFEKGVIRSLETDMKLINFEDVSFNSDYFTPNGPMKNTFKFQALPQQSGQHKMMWTIQY